MLNTTSSGSMIAINFSARQIIERPGWEVYLLACLAGHDVRLCPSKTLKNKCDCEESAERINKTRQHIQPDFFFLFSRTEFLFLFFLFGQVPSPQGTLNIPGWTPSKWQNITLMRKSSSSSFSTLCLLALLMAAHGCFWQLVGVTLNVKRKKESLTLSKQKFLKERKGADVFAKLH